MSKKNTQQAAVVEAPVTEVAQVEATTTEVTKVESSHKHNLPADGSKGEEFIKECGGVSKAIRILTDDGHKRGAVAKMLNKRYQHVRNVLITPIKKEG